jgi:hypothetical protein
MADQLKAARLKLDRAEEHLRSFDRESADWLEQTKFCRFAMKEDGDKGIISVDITAVPPARLSAILGDCLQNLRASLDYLCWELVIANNQTPGRWTGFPIYRSWDYVKRPQFHPNCVTGIDSEAIALMERLQPYYGGKNPDISPLWFLHELSNTDKHRTITIIVGQVVIEKFRLAAGSTALNPLWLEAEVLHDGEECATFRLRDVEAGQTVHVEAETLGFITLGPALPWGAFPVSRHVEHALDIARNVVFPMFEPFFA